MVLNGWTFGGWEKDSDFDGHKQRLLKIPLDLSPHHGRCYYDIGLEPQKIRITIEKVKL